MSVRAEGLGLLAVAVFASTVLAADPKKKVAVLDFTGDAKLATSLTRLVASELAKDPRLEILSREDINALLGLERQRAIMGCIDSSCLSEVGSALEAQWVIGGAISPLGSGYLITAQLLDTSLARVLNRAVVRPKSADELAAQAGALARELLSEPALLLLYNQRPGAGVFLDDKFLGKLPLDPAPLHVTGRHALRVEGAEFVPWQQEIELVAGRSARVSLELETVGELEGKSRARRGWAIGFTTAGAAGAAGAIALFVSGMTAMDNTRRSIHSIRPRASSTPWPTRCGSASVGVTGRVDWRSPRSSPASSSSSPIPSPTSSPR